MLCPASPPASRSILRKAAEAIRAVGLRPMLGPNSDKRSRFLAGADDERVQDLHWAIRHPEVKGIFAIRGGYGTMRLLPQIDWRLVRRHPKVVLGMSDVTALQVATLRHGVVTFAGPMLAFQRSVGFSPWAWDRLREAVAGASPVITVAPGDPPPVAIAPGRACGPLVGGNLTTLLSLVATPWEYPLRGCIVVLEEVNEAPYRVDRMLTQFMLAGRLEGIAGIAFGRFHQCYKQSEHEIVDVLAERVGCLGVPVLYGLALGHQRDVATWPQGCTAELDAALGVLRVLEPGVG